VSISQSVPTSKPVEALRHRSRESMCSTSDCFDNVPLARFLVLHALVLDPADAASQSMLRLLTGHPASTGLYSGQYGGRKTSPTPASAQAANRNCTPRNQSRSGYGVVMSTFFGCHGALSITMVAAPPLRCSSRSSTKTNHMQNTREVHEPGHTDGVLDFATERGALTLKSVCAR
jgi:hypothetical protein